MRVRDMPETRILTYETLRELPAAPAPQLPPQPRAGGGRISLAEAERVLGRAPLWPARGGPVVRSLGTDAVELRGGDVVISQSAAGDAVAYLAGVRGYLPPEGSVLMEGAIGLMRAGGLVVAIHAADEGRILSIARSLQ